MLNSKVALKGLDRENKSLKQNIIDLFPGSPADPDRWSLHGERRKHMPITG